MRPLLPATFIINYYVILLIVKKIKVSTAIMIIVIKHSVQYMCRLDVLEDT